MDEIGDMDTRLQSKMLRFLQDFRFTRVGGSESLHTDTRVIAATNRNPKQQIQDGTLREDLYYRLNVVPVDLPPLRERKEDILVLANHFLQRLQDKYSKYFVSFSSEAVRLMLSYSWPGNVRELQNTIERIIVLSNSDRITAELFPEEIREAAAGSLLPELQVEEVQRLVEELRSEQPEPVDPPADGEDILPFEEVERRTILEALEKCGGDISKAARKLGLSRATIYRKLEKYGQK
jgi:DNA-binding NtrC family response regulator